MSLLAQIGGPTALLLLALVVMIGILMMRSHRYFSRQDRSPIVRAERPQRPLPGPHGAPHGVPPDSLAQWEVDLHETARDLSAQLDSKMGVLQHLVCEADRAAARLEKALAVGDCAAPGGRGPAAGEARPKDPAAPASPDRRCEEICTLADYGFEPAEIARRLGAPIGEIESVLDVRAKRP